MLKRNPIKLVGSILLGGTVMLGILSACGGPAAETKPIPAPPPTLAPTPAPTPAPAPVTAIPVSRPADSNGHVDPQAQGKLIWEEAAGGVGCAYCHGLEGKGSGTSGQGAPNIRGTNKSQIRRAVAGGVPLMSFIKLNEEELAAVAEYVQYLSAQP